MKTCTRCGSEGPFYRVKSYKDGLDYYCKKCRDSTHVKTPLRLERQRLSENLARLLGKRGALSTTLSVEERAKKIRRVSGRLALVKTMCAAETMKRRNDALSGLQ